MDDHSPINNIDIYSFVEPSLRCNTDKHPTDKRGEIVIELCKNARLRILNGRTRGDRLGNFTRYPLSLRENPSTIDYMLCDIELLKRIKYFTTLHHLGLSDHECWAGGILTKGFSCDRTPDPPLVNNKPFNYVSTQQFCMRLSGPLGVEKTKTFIKKFQNSNESQIENMSNELVGIISTAYSTESRRNIKNSKN